MPGQHVGAQGGPASPKAWTRGWLTAFVKGHALAWELVSAALTVVYVVLAFLQDQGASGAVTPALLVIASIFVIEFSLRLYDSPSRRTYVRHHWLDIVTCIPVIGSLRALRLVRLLAFLRLGASVRAFGVGTTATERMPGGAGLWLLAPILIIVWVASAYGYFELEHGINPQIKTFGDALYFSFVTASTVGYGDVTPLTPAGKILSGVLIFVGIGLLGFASSQLTARLLPQRNELAELKTSLHRMEQLLRELHERLGSQNSEPDRESALTEGSVANTPRLR